MKKVFVSFLCAALFLQFLLTAGFAEDPLFEEALFEETLFEETLFEETLFEEPTFFPEISEEIPEATDFVPPDDEPSEEIVWEENLSEPLSDETAADEIITDSPEVLSDEEETPESEEPFPDSLGTPEEDPDGAGNGETEVPENMTDAPEDTAAGEEGILTEPDEEENDVDENLTENSEAEYPVFSSSQTLDNVTVSVYAEEGIFPKDAVLFAEQVPACSDEAVSELRSSDSTVAASYTFDIKVIHPVTGDEYQPAEGQTVSVSFHMEEVADQNLETQVYHISDDGSAEELEVETDEQTATVETQGFSLYTVEFTYNHLQYVLSGDSEIPLIKILEEIGLKGVVTEVECSDDSLFSASDGTGEWVVKALQPFQSDQWMKVTIDGVVYEIKVTDDIASDPAWNIDDDGCLHITGAVTYSTAPIAPPWQPYMSQITSVVAEAGSSTNNANGLFYHGKNITSIDLSELDTSGVTDMQNMFDDCPSLTTVNLSNLNTSNVTTFYNMFRGCSNLESLDLGSFDTQKVKSMTGMFTNCSKLTALDLSNFQTPALTNMQAMFFECTALEILDVSGFDTSKVTTMSQTFYRLKALKNLDIKHFNTSNVTSMYGMFDGCEALTDLDVTNFNTSSVTAMNNMFRNCKSLTSIDVTGFKTSKVTSVTGMFENCISLTEIDLSQLDITNATVRSGILRGCKSLEKISATADIFNNEKEIIIKTIHSPWKNEDSDEFYFSPSEIGSISEIDTIIRAYTITVNNDGNGTASASKTAASAGETITLTATPNTGYHFKEWQTLDVSMFGNVFFMAKKNVTITAFFEPNIYTVTFNVQGHGTAPAAQPVKYGELVSNPGTLTETGYAFEGWYTDAACNTAFDFNTAITGDTTVYAKWKQLLFDVNILILGHGAAGANPNPALAGEEVLLSATPAEGYRFKEWQSSDVTVTDNKFSMPARAVTVTAVFEEIPRYTVSFYMNGHGTAPASQTVREGGTAAKPAKPAADGWKFEGWYTDAGCTAEFDFHKPIYADTIVFAKWRANYYKPYNPKYPQTGDSSHVLLWGSLLAVSGAALTGTAIVRRKRKSADVSCRGKRQHLPVKQGRQGLVDQKTKHHADQPLHHGERKVED